MKWPCITTTNKTLPFWWNLLNRLVVSFQLPGRRDWASCNDFSINQLPSLACLSSSSLIVDHFVDGSKSSSINVGAEKSINEVAIKEVKKSAKGAADVVIHVDN